MATPAAYRSSQTRGWIRAVAVALHHSHSNAKSELRLGPTPEFQYPWGCRIEPASSWIRVRFVSTEPRQKLQHCSSLDFLAKGSQEGSFDCWVVGGETTANTLLVRLTWPDQQSFGQQNLLPPTCPLWVSASHAGTSSARYPPRLQADSGLQDPPQLSTLASQVNFLVQIRLIWVFYSFFKIDLVMEVEPIVEKKGGPVVAQQ